MDRGKQGMKRSVATDGHDIPLHLFAAPANAHDSPLLEPTLAGIVDMIGTLPQYHDLRGRDDFPNVHLDTPWSSAPSPCSGTLRPTARRALLVVPLVGVAVGGVWTANHLLDERAYVTTDDARIDSDAIVLRAPASGTLVDWNAGQGRTLHRDEPVGRIQINGGFGRPT